MHRLALGCLLALGLLSGCGASGSCLPPPSQRTVSVLATAGLATGQLLTGAAPLDVQVQLQAGLKADDAGRPAAQVVQQAAVDFGDGGGWTDLTAQFAAQAVLGAAGGTVLSGTLAQHTYAAPGTYSLQARLTFYDGDMVTAWNPVQVVVTQ